MLRQISLVIFHFEKNRNEISAGIEYLTGRSRDAVSEKRLLRSVKSNVSGFESMGQSTGVGAHQGSR